MRATITERGFMITGDADSMRSLRFEIEAALRDHRYSVQAGMPAPQISIHVDTDVVAGGSNTA